MHRRSFTIEEMKRRPLLVEVVLVGAFNQEKALVGAFSMIVKTLRNLRKPSFEALLIIRAGFVQKHHCCTTASLDANKRVEVKSSPIHFHPQIIHCTVGDDVE